MYCRGDGTWGVGGVIFQKVPGWPYPIKGSKSRKKNLVSSNLPKNKRTSLILSTRGAQDSEFRLFFGRIQDAIICFRDLLTFSDFNAKIDDYYIQGKFPTLILKYLLPASCCLGWVCCLQLLLRPLLSILLARINNARDVSNFFPSEKLHPFHNIEQRCIFTRSFLVITFTVAIQ